MLRPGSKHDGKRLHTIHLPEPSVTSFVSVNDSLLLTNWKSKKAAATPKIRTSWLFSITLFLFFEW